MLLYLSQVSDQFGMNLTLGKIKVKKQLAKDDARWRLSYCI